MFSVSAAPNLLAFSTDGSKDALNSARGHLRVLLSNWLFKKVKAMMEVSCDCKEKTVYQYIKALVETKGYPIDEQNRKSINEVCKNLATFPVHFKLPESSKSCSTCNSDWEYIVSSAIDSIKKHFDGLCLDCMDHTQPQFLDEHWDYWNHLSSGRQWDRNCRVKHSQSTWYSSFSMSKAILFWIRILTRSSGPRRYQRSHP